MFGKIIHGIEVLDMMEKARGRSSNSLQKMKAWSSTLSDFAR